MKRTGAQVGGMVLITYGLVHLLVWPGAPTGPDGGRLRWNGDSWAPGWIPAAVVESIGGVLLALALLGCLVGGAGFLGLPGARRFPLLAAGIGAGSSMCLFALAWPGLEPTSSEFAAGPVLSAALLGGVLAAQWAGRRSTAGPAPAPSGPSKDSSPKAAGTSKGGTGGKPGGSSGTPAGQSAR